MTTDANGKITVLLSTHASLKDANGKEIVLTPATATGTALTAASSIGSTQVGQVFCGPASGAAGIDKKYLPGSCKS